MNDTPSPYGPNGATLPPAQNRLDGIMPRVAVKPRFLELTAKPTRYTLTGLKAGGPKTATGHDGKTYELNVLVIAQLRDTAGARYEWELTAKTAHRDLRAILEALPATELDAILDGAGQLELELAVTGKGTSTAYLVRPVVLA